MQYYGLFSVLIIKRINLKNDIMKKILFLAVAAMMATLSVNGQDAYADLKHEVAISTGAVSTSNVIDIFQIVAAVEQQDGVSYDLRNFHGPYSIEYFYRAKPWLGVGGMFIYGNGKIKASDTNSGGMIAETKGNYVSFLPAVKLDWVRRQYFGMYSKVALGATIRNVQLTRASYSRSDEAKTTAHLNGHVTLVGMDFGSPHFRGFGELGFGEQGVLLIGLRYKF